ncbi:MAG: hypothetical protein R3217_08280 [Gammaproteobacteria bacterium]|nr:hypothetical protein [Gammaproteobacteria bacterium]
MEQKQTNQRLRALAFSGLLAVSAGLGFSAAANASELTGEVEYLARYFVEPPAWPGQVGNDGTLASSDHMLKVKLEYYQDWNGGDTRLVITPVGRYIDGNAGFDRSDGDVEELYLRQTVGNSDFYFGYRKIFWGVTESVHLVDIVNQSDVVEDIDLEDRLGQPMLQWSTFSDFGTFDVIVMPVFRERRLPESEQRLRPFIPYLDDPLYEDSEGDEHVDVAIRWSQFIGDWDIGVSHFSGTAREPLFIPGLDGDGNAVLRPFYAQLDQTSVDLQATKGSWLWKLEVASRDQLDDRNTRLAGGFEYSFYGVQGSDADLGVIAEYLFDDAGDNATSPFEDDIFIGGRLAFNDVAGSEILAGVFHDLDGEGRVYSVEASRRIGNSWKVALTARVFESDEMTSLLYSFRQDDFLSFSVTKYF